MGSITNTSGSSDSSTDSESTRTNTLPPPSKEELALIKAITGEINFRRKQLGKLDPLADDIQSLATVGIDQLARSIPTEAALDKQRDQLALSESGLALDASKTSGELGAFEAQDILRSGKASPDDIKNINAAAGAAIEQGGSDIDAGVEDALRSLRDVTATSRGLSIRDTPILDRGQLIAREGLRQKSQLSRGARLFGAEQRLQHPLNRGAVQSQRVSALEDRSTSIREFQQGLRQQAFLNRLTLGNTAAALRLGAVNATTDPTAALAGVQRPRLLSGTQSFSGSSDTESSFSQREGKFNLLGGICWVADVLFGEGSDQAGHARLWARNNGSSPWIRLYARYGEAWAAWLEPRPWAQRIVAPIWRWMARKGKEMNDGWR
jgi:hypothetical protein